MVSVLIVFIADYWSAFVESGLSMGSFLNKKPIIDENQLIY